MLMIAGKVLMDNEKFAPDSLREDAKQSYLDSKALIQKWHGKGRCLYAVTVSPFPQRQRSWHWQVTFARVW